MTTKNLNLLHADTKKWPILMLVKTYRGQDKKFTLNWHSYVKSLQ